MRLAIVRFNLVRYISVICLSLFVQKRSEQLLGVLPICEFDFLSLLQNGIANVCVMRGRIHFATSMNSVEMPDRIVRIICYGTSVVVDHPRVN